MFLNTLFQHTVLVKVRLIQHLKQQTLVILTRRLVDVAQDVVVTMDDCKTLGYVEIEDLKESGDTVYPMAHRVFGRVLAADVKDPVTGELLLSQGDVSYS